MASLLIFFTGMARIWENFSRKALASIVDNRVRNVFGDGTGLGHGIHGTAVSRLTLTGNQVIGGAGTGTAISCSDAVSTARNNTVAGFGTGITGCDDDGGNLLNN